jgi:hypothetical protein
VARAVAHAVAEGAGGVPARAIRVVRVEAYPDTGSSKKRMRKAVPASVPAVL